MENHDEMERQKELLQLRQSVMKAEQQRLAGVPGCTTEEIRKMLKERIMNQKAVSVQNTSK